MDYSVLQTAELLGVKVRTVRDWLSKGKIQASKLEWSRQWMISDTEIERIRAERSVKKS